MSEIAWYTFVMLAVWRITKLMVDEDGPYDIFARFRVYIGVRYDENSNPYGTNLVSKAILCMWCFSIWTGVIGGILISKNAIEFIVTWLATSAVVIAIDRMIDDKNRV